MRQVVKDFFNRLDTQLMSIPPAGRRDILNLLSAQRGPDNGDATEKWYTVARIRAKTLPEASNWACRDVNDDGKPVKWNEDGQLHFCAHMQLAVRAFDAEDGTGGV